MNDGDTSQRTIQKLFRLIDSGQITHAEVRCRNAVAQAPDDVNLLALLGAIYLKLERLDDARAALEKAIELEPGFAKPHEDLGALHLRQGNAEEALACFDTAIERNAASADSWAGRASALSRIGRQDEASEAQQRYVALSPLAQGLQKAERMLSDGDAESAQASCEALRAQYPNNTELLRMQARIATVREQPIVAEGLLKQVINLNEKDDRGFADLGLFYGQIGRVADAVASLRMALAISPDRVGIRQRLADFLALLGRSGDALDEYDRVLQNDRQYSPAMTGRGHMLRMLGRGDDALRAYESAIASEPLSADAWWGLASFRGHCISQSQHDQLQQLAGNKDLPAGQRATLLFALARSCESRGDYDAAWRCYEHGNTLKRSTLSYDPVRTERFIQCIIDVFDHKRLAGARQAQRESGIAASAVRPIFVVGMPRSGSTLIEQILASHSQIEATFELPFMPMLADTLGRANGGNYPDIVGDLATDRVAAMGKTYLYYTKSSRRAGSAFFVDKLPANFLHVGLIVMCLPEAIIIDARRDPLDTCIGNYRQLFAKGKEHAYDLFECAEYCLGYQRLMQHWDRVLPGRILRVNYEEVVSDLETQAKRLVEHCGLPWEDACLSFHRTERSIATASAEQVRSPLYADAVGYWRHYARYTGELQATLERELAG